MAPAAAVRRGPGRPRKKMLLQQRAAAAPKRKLIGKPRNWTRRVCTDGHLELTRWVVVEGSEKNRRFEQQTSQHELLAVAAENSFSEVLEKSLLFFFFLIYLCGEGGRCSCAAGPSSDAHSSWRR